MPAPLEQSKGRRRPVRAKLPSGLQELKDSSSQHRALNRRSHFAAAGAVVVLALVVVVAWVIR